MVGYVTALTDGVSCAYLPHLEVVPSHRGRGIGTELVRRLLARPARLYMVDLVCDPALVPFYARLGRRPATAMILRRSDTRPRPTGRDGAAPRPPPRPTPGAQQGPPPGAEGSAVPTAPQSAGAAAPTRGRRGPRRRGLSQDRAPGGSASSSTAPRPPRLPTAHGAGHQPGAAARARRAGVPRPALGAARPRPGGAAAASVEGLLGSPAVALFVRHGGAGGARLRAHAGDRGRPWPSCAGAWTGCRWRSSSPPPGPSSSPRRRCSTAWRGRRPRAPGVARRGRPRPAGAPADGAEHDRLEPRPARAGRAGALPAARRSSPAGAPWRRRRPSAAGGRRRRWRGSRSRHGGGHRGRQGTASCRSPPASRRPRRHRGARGQQPAAAGGPAGRGGRGGRGAALPDAGDRPRVRPGAAGGQRGGGARSGRGTPPTSTPWRCGRRRGGSPGSARTGRRCSPPSGTTCGRCCGGRWTAGTWRSGWTPARRCSTGPGQHLPRRGPALAGAPARAARRGGARPRPRPRAERPRPCWPGSRATGTRRARRPRRASRCGARWATRRGCRWRCARSRSSAEDGADPAANAAAGEALRLARAAGSPVAAAFAHNAAGLLAARRADWPVARAAFEQGGRERARRGRLPGVATRERGRGRRSRRATTTARRWRATRRPSRCCGRPAPPRRGSSPARWWPSARPPAAGATRTGRRRPSARRWRSGTASARP